MTAQTTIATSKRRVRFGPVSEVCYDGTLTPDEKKLLWHDPDVLKKTAKEETHLARRLWKTRSKPPPNFVFRGLEKRMKSSDALRRKWYSFLQSFLALQKDLLKLDSDNSNILSVFCATHSKSDRAKALQVGRQDAAIAQQIYHGNANDTKHNKKMQQLRGNTATNTLDLSSSHSKRVSPSPTISPSNSSKNVATAATTTFGQQQQRQQKGCQRARSA